MALCLHACDVIAGRCRYTKYEGQQAHLMVPFGLRHIFFKPNSFTLPSSGVIVAHLMPTLYLCRGSRGPGMSAGAHGRSSKQDGQALREAWLHGGQSCMACASARLPSTPAGPTHLCASMTHTGCLCLNGGGCPVACQPTCYKSMRCSPPQETQVPSLMSHLGGTRFEHQPT